MKEDAGRIVRFHPALRDTLLGLRLMQLDMLIISEDAADLPKRNDEYVLGRGEVPPDLAANEAAAVSIRDRLDEFAKRHESFDSYVSKTFLNPQCSFHCWFWIFQTAVAARCVLFHPRSEFEGEDQFGWSISRSKRRSVLLHVGPIQISAGARCSRSAHE